MLDELIEEVEAMRKYALTKCYADEIGSARIDAEIAAIDQVLALLESAKERVLESEATVFKDDRHFLVLPHEKYQGMFSELEGETVQVLVVKGKDHA